MTERVCKCGCGADLSALRSDAKWATESCRKRARRSNTPDQARTRIHVRIGPALEFDVPPDWPQRSARFWRGMREIERKFS